MRTSKARFTLASTNLLAVAALLGVVLVAPATLAQQDGNTAAAAVEYFPGDAVTQGVVVIDGEHHGLMFYICRHWLPHVEPDLFDERRGLDRLMKELVSPGGEDP